MTGWEGGEDDNVEAGEDDNVEAGEDDDGEGSGNNGLDPRPFAVILGLAPGIQ